MTEKCIKENGDVSCVPDERCGNCEKGPDKMTTKKPIEQRAFDAFKKQRGLLTETPSELPEVYRGWWIDFQDGYLAAAKAEQKEIISDEKIRKLGSIRFAQELAQLSNSEDNGDTDVNGDTFSDRISKHIRKILETPDEKNYFTAWEKTIKNVMKDKRPRT